MKILEKCDDLIGKTIKAIDLQSGFDEIGYIITEDNEIYAFDIDSYDQYIYERDEYSVKSSIRRSSYIRKDLFESGVITEEEYEAIEKEHQERIKEQQLASQKREYETYLKLKEKYENK